MSDKSPNSEKQYPYLPSYLPYESPHSLIILYFLYYDSTRKRSRRIFLFLNFAKFSAKILPIFYSVILINHIDKLQIVVFISFLPINVGFLRCSAGLFGNIRQKRQNFRHFSVASSRRAFYKVKQAIKNRASKARFQDTCFHTGSCLCQYYTLKRNRITSPSFTTYSLPSIPTSPFSRAAASDPSSRRTL